MCGRGLGGGGGTISVLSSINQKRKWMSHQCHDDTPKITTTTYDSSIALRSLYAASFSGFGVHMLLNQDALDVATSTAVSLTGGADVRLNPALELLRLRFLLAPFPLPILLSRSPPPPPPPKFVEDSRRRSFSFAFISLTCSFKT